jgi:hypothetical protein
MDVKGIYPKDVAVIVEFRASELEKIKVAMDDCKLTYFGPDKDKMDAQEFFKTNFYSFLTELVKTLKDE